MQVQPYLFFDGRCEEALDFYKKSLGAKTRVTLRGTFPSAEDRARVIREYGADKGLTQTLVRLGEYVEGLKS